MLSIQDIRNRTEELKRAVQQKNKKVDVDKILELDDKRKSLQQKIDELKHQQKQAGKERDIEKAKELKTQIQAGQKEHDAIFSELKDLTLALPNFIHPDVPEGKDESENVIIKKVGFLPQFDFEPKDHQEIGEKLGLIDKEQAAKVTGSRFYYLKGEFAQLQFALVQYTFDILTNEETLKKIAEENNLNVSTKPFTITIPPVIVNQDTALRMGRLHPKDDRYCIEEDNLMFIGSAEHSLGPIHMDDTLKEEALPIRYVAYTACFRREAGTYGKDTRGIFRNHQFDKIEMESFTTKEDGEKEQDFIVAIQQHLVKELKIPYELVYICTGDMGGNDYRQFDINCYLPGQKKYRETHTSDYMTDFQARRLNTKIQKSDGSKELAHMNDATAFAFPRILIAIIENFQQADGSIAVPEVLQPYMGGKKQMGTT